LNNNGFKSKKWVGAKRDVKDMLSAVKSLTLHLLYLLFWSIFTVWKGYEFFNYAECHWFGSSFEGGCGFAMVFYTLIVGSCIIVCLSIITIISYFIELNFVVLNIILFIVVVAGFGAYKALVTPSTDSLTDRIYSNPPSGQEQ